MSDSSLALPEPTDEEPAAASPTAAAAPARAAGAPADASLALEAPAPVSVVAPATAQDTVPINAADRARLDSMVARYLDAVSNLDLHGTEFSDKVKDIGNLGGDDIRASAAVSNRLLEKPLAAMEKGGLTESSAVSKSLLSLRREVEDLDPSRQGDLVSPHKLLGLLPFGAGNRLRDYFDKYRSSQHQLDSIITSLNRGRDELQRDNASIEQEKVNLWAVMGRLRQYSYLANSLDAALTERIASMEASDPERAKVLQQDMLFAVRQKNQDLLTQLAVSVQGYLALDVIRRNNLELINGVERATTTTVSALRTAVIVAQALVDQKLVLDQITALNTTTSNLIESTSAMLHQQSGAINEQAASATVDLARLQAAFRNIYATMDEIDTFKVQALGTMKQTVTALSAEITRSQGYLDRGRAGETQTAAIDALGSGSIGSDSA
jgi:uncharacterized protein YaaN involved in tellurite resistance